MPGALEGAELELPRDTQNDALELEGAPDAATAAPLSFQVYTLADLDARRPDSDPSNRLSRMVFELAPKPPSPWILARDRTRELAVEAAGWVSAWACTPKAMPSAEPVRARAGIARGSLLLALRTVDWQRASIFGGATLGSLVTLLAITLTVADMTDDLKPARAAREPDARAVSSSAVAAAAPIAAPAAESPPLELDEVDAAPAPAAPAATAASTTRSVRLPAPRPTRLPARAALAYSGAPLHGGPLAMTPPSRSPGGAKGAARTKLSFRDADEVFRP
jgi:hypothetical protein